MTSGPSALRFATEIPRLDGMDKLCGKAEYVDDIHVAGVWHGATVRSHVARGRIKAVRFDPAVSWSEFAIADHRDLPRNAVKLIDADQPALAASEVRHCHEPIVLLAHPSLEQVRRAVRAIRIEIEEWTAQFDAFDAPPADRVQHGPDNVFKRIDIRKGNPAAVFAEAPFVVEGIYQTGAQEHVYIEPNGMLARRENGCTVVRGSMQCPYYVLKSLTYAFARGDDAFRIIQSPTGGGFGGKEDYPSVIAIHAALLAEKSGAPVKIVYDRQEDMAATTKRHPSRVRHRTAVDGDGRLLAMEIEILLDGGAYVTLSPVVLSRGCIHAAGPYYCDNIHIHGEARLTNSPPYGAFRGFGAPQTIFALERHLDVIAARLGMDPVELRRRNLLHTGQSTATGQVIREDIDLAALQDNTVKAINLRQRSAEHAEFNRRHPYLRRGVGIATFFHGAGFTGSGETMLASKVRIEGHRDGRIEVLAANTDMGQGTQTILTQVAAERLSVPIEHVTYGMPDTSRVPDSGPTVASRTAMVVGRLVEQACDDLRAQLGGTSGPAATALQVAIQAWHAAHPGARLIGETTYQKPDWIQWDDAAYRGDAYACYSWACYAADVEVDLRTYQVRVADFVARQSVGRVIHPTLARGQIAGGVVQGIGWALMEDVILDQGAMKNHQMTNYIIPTSSDLPPIRVYFDGTPSEFGPGGAKGIGELPMDGPAPAVVNAVCRALNVQSLNMIPLTPERLMAQVEPA